MHGPGVCGVFVDANVWYSRTLRDWDGGRIAAIRDRWAGTFETGHADVLVTFNASDFVWDENTSAYEVMHPDDFLTLVDESNPGLVTEVIGRMCTYWVDRTGEVDLPLKLRHASCPEFAERVLVHLHQQM